MIRINSWEISSYPLGQIEERFGKVNRCQVDVNHYRLEILFGPNGELLTKQSLIRQLEKYFKQKYIPVSVDGEIGYASVVRKDTATYRGPQPEKVKLHG